MTPICSHISTLSTLSTCKDAEQLTASRSSAGIASLLGLLVAASAEIVSAGVDDDGALLEMSVEASKLCYTSHP
jgi:hypothetical protein